MVQLFCLVPCDHCGIVAEVDIPLPTNIIINEEVVTKICESELPKWGYIYETDEWMCDDCQHKPLTFKISDETLKQFQANVEQKTWAWEKLIKKGVAEQLGIDSDSVKAEDVDVKAYMDPSSLATEFYIAPAKGSWSELKKRHPAKESASRVP